MELQVTENLSLMKPLFPAIKIKKGFLLHASVWRVIHLMEHFASN